MLKIGDIHLRFLSATIITSLTFYRRFFYHSIFYASDSYIGTTTQCTKSVGTLFIQSPAQLSGQSNERQVLHQASQEHSERRSILALPAGRITKPPLSTRSIPNLTALHYTATQLLITCTYMSKIHRQSIAVSYLRIQVLKAPGPAPLNSRIYSYTTRIRQLNKEKTVMCIP